MDEITEIGCLVEGCDFKAKNLTEWDKHMRRAHPDRSWIGPLVTGILVAFIPAVILGAIVTWLAWDVKPHNAAVIVGLITTLAVMWQGGWIALIVGSAEER